MNQFLSTVADPGFPQGGGANSWGGAPTYNFAKISRKLHEIERSWMPGGRGVHVPRAPLNPPMVQLDELDRITQA